MVKLTVIYNLPPDADHEAFLKWRTTTHQEENASMPGLIKTDFYIVKRAWGQDKLPYHYITEAYFPDMETFEKSFFDSEYQAGLVKSMERIADPLFLISDEVVTQVVKR